MKRLISLFVIVVLILSLCGAVSAEENVIEIYDAAGLMAMADDPYAHYQLMADIDMRGIEWKPLAFFGQFDGRGHAIYNLRVTDVGDDTRITRDGNMKEYDTTFAGLFSVLEKAVVRNLRLIGVDVNVTNETHCFAAGLAGYANRSTIQDCSVQGRIYMTSYSVMVGVSGLVGFGCGKFERCDVKVELFFEDRYAEGRCEEFMAGILACGIAEINTCVVEIDGYDSCHGYVHNGGVVGMYYHCGTDYPKSPVNDNIISGRIRFFEDNPDRRAYCKAVIGESLSKPSKSKGNTDSFTRDEVKVFDVVLRPELCDVPDYVEKVIEPNGGRWGYVRHECSGCGYRYTDNYSAQ